MSTEARVESRERFAESVRGKTVALVGGAESLLYRGDGESIDACEVVVRVNWPRDASHVAERTGVRTDWHYRAGGMKEEGPDILRKSVSVARELRKEANTTRTPRTGVIALAEILQYDPISVYVAGFDLYRSAHSVMPRRRAQECGGHDNRIDYRLLTRLCADPRVFPDAVLQEALELPAMTEAEVQDVHIQEALGLRSGDKREHPP